MVASITQSPPAEVTRAAFLGAARRARSREDALHDAGLVRRFNDGDQDAFAEIVRRHRAKMHQVALGLLKNHGDAEEIAQDTFIRAHRGLANFRGDSSLATWLHCIATNLARNRYWYFFRRKKHVTRSLDSPVREGFSGTYADLVPSGEPGPTRETDNREFVARVAECTQRLNASQQQILRLRIVQRHSYEEIGLVLGIATGTVKSRIARARENLRSLLAPIYAVNTAGALSRPTVLGSILAARMGSSLLREVKGDRATSRLAASAI
jgi:RNA polymerase sigma-70 factor (ECF subfamily)